MICAYAHLRHPVLHMVAELWLYLHGVSETAQEHLHDDSEEPLHEDEQRQIENGSEENYDKDLEQIYEREWHYLSKPWHLRTMSPATA